MINESNDFQEVFEIYLFDLIDGFVLFIVPERFLNERQESIKVALRELQKLRIYSIDIRIFDVTEKFFSSWTERRAICNFHYLQHRFEKAVA